MLWNQFELGIIPGWWIMPLCGLIYIFIFMYFISKFFKSEEKWDELLLEIEALRCELDSLHQNKKENMLKLIKGTNTKYIREATIL